MEAQLKAEQAKDSQAPAESTLTRVMEMFRNVKYRPVANPEHKVVIWSPAGGALELLALDMGFALALNRRGSEVVFCLCGGAMSGCVLRSADDGKSVEQWPSICGKCIEWGRQLLDWAGIPYCTMKELLSEDRLADMRTLAKTWAWGDAPSDVAPEEPKVAHWFYTQRSMVRYFRGLDRVVPEAQRQAVLEEYYYSSLVCEAASLELVQHHGADRMLLANGQYAEFGSAQDAALQAGALTTGYMTAHKRNHFYASNGAFWRRAEFREMEKGVWEELVRNGLTADKERELAEYWESISCQRGKGIFAPALGDTMASLGLSGKRPVWVLFCHVHWDVISRPGSELFPSVHEWLLRTMERMIRLDGVDWVVRVHPDETCDGTILKTEDFLAEVFPELPEHVHVVYGRGINSYELMDLADGAVTIRGTPGGEMLLLGKPVILAGTAHYGQMGFTYDADTVEDYFDLLDRASSFGPLSEEQRRLATLWAHHMFVERQIPISAFDCLDLRFSDEHGAALEPGRDPGLDVFCNGILHGEPFIYDDPAATSG